MVALGQTATHAEQEVRLFAGFHALGHGGQAEAVGMDRMVRTRAPPRPLVSPMRSTKVLSTLMVCNGRDMR